MNYVYFDWKKGELLRPMFACQEDWDALQAMADAWWELMRTQKAPKCESTGRK